MHDARLHFFAPPHDAAPAEPFMRLVTASFALVLLCLSLSSSVRAGTPGLRINEIMAGPARDWDGSGTFSSRDDEWVELRNPGASALDLAGYLVTDGDSIPRMALSGTLTGGGRLVIFGKQSYDWERANGQPAFGLSLGNSGDAVLLWQIAAGETLLVDAYTYRSHEAAADRAIGRLNDDGEWQLFDALDPYTGTLLPHGNGCSPSPGAPNGCGVTKTEKSATWGRLKALYR